MYYIIFRKAAWSLDKINKFNIFRFCQVSKGWINFIWDFLNIFSCRPPFYPWFGAIAGYVREPSIPGIGQCVLKLFRTQSFNSRFHRTIMSDQPLAGQLGVGSDSDQADWFSTNGNCKLNTLGSPRYAWLADSELESCCWIPKMACAAQSHLHSSVVCETHCFNPPKTGVWDLCW